MEQLSPLQDNHPTSPDVRARRGRFVSFTAYMDDDTENDGNVATMPLAMLTQTPQPQPRKAGRRTAVSFQSQSRDVQDMQETASKRAQKNLQRRFKSNKRLRDKVKTIMNDNKVENNTLETLQNEQLEQKEEPENQQQLKLTLVDLNDNNQNNQHTEKVYEEENKNSKTKVDCMTRTPERSHSCSKSTTTTYRKNEQGKQLIAKAKEHHPILKKTPAKIFKNLIRNVRKMKMNERDQDCEYFRRYAILESLQKSMKNPDYVNLALAETISCPQCRTQIYSSNKRSSNRCITEK